MIAKIAASFLLLNVVLIGCLVHAQEENFQFETGSGRRTGVAKLLSQPDKTAARSTIKFSTTQSGVGHTNKFRLAVQWISSKNRQELSTWQSAVFQLRVPQGGGSESPAIEQILQGAYYDRYVRQGQIWNDDQYVDLVLVDRNQQVTIDVTNNYAGTDDGGNFKVTDSRVVVGTDTLVDIEFSAPLLDPVGVNQIWFKWIFYNDDPFCDSSRFENYCFATAPIDGQKEGYSYTTYVAWTDFYKKGDVMTYIWIIYGLSFFGALGFRGMDFVAFLLQVYLAINSINGWVQGGRHLYFENYTGENIVMILLTHFFFWAATELLQYQVYFWPFGLLTELGIILLIDTYLTNLDGYL